MSREPIAPFAYPINLFAPCFTQVRSALTPHNPSTTLQSVSCGPRSRKTVGACQLQWNA
jgi:hypothetical protein